MVLAADLLYDDDMTESLCQFLRVYLQAAAALRACSHNTSGAYRGWESKREGGSTPQEDGADGLIQPNAVLRRCYERPTVILAAEKRYIFTVDDADVRAPAFEHFLSQLRLLTEEENADRLNVRKRDSRDRDRECTTGQMQLVGRFLDAGGVERAVGGFERSSELVLMEIWLEVW